jgi:drug/metabolite transporter (DMT)-like permease
MDNMNSMNARQFAQLVLLSAVWGASFPLIRVAAPAFGPIVMACLRCALAAVVLGVLMRFTRQTWPKRAHWVAITFLSGLTVVGPFVLHNWAGLVLPAGYSAVLNATAPLFGVLAGAMFSDERLTVSKVIGCMAGFAGVALLVGLGPVAIDRTVILATLACVAAAACFGFGAILMKRATMEHQPLPASAAVHLAGALVLLPAVPVTVPTAQVGADALLALIVLGTVTSGLMYWVSMRLMHEIPASAATCSAFLIPMFGVSWGAIFLGEPLRLGLLPGFGLVLLASALVTGFNPLHWLAKRKRVNTGTAPQN